MPPANSLANSPTRLEADPSLSQITPPLSPSTRLPILRTSNDGEASWRHMLARAIDQVSDDSVEQRSHQNQDVLNQTATSQSAIPYPVMSTYRGWAPGTIEHERPPTNRFRRSDHSSTSTATRRYRREQEMSQSSGHQGQTDVPTSAERDTMEWETSRTSPRRRDNGTPAFQSLRAHAMMEAVRRQRVETLRERIHNFASARGHSDQAQQLNALEEYAHLTHEYARDTMNTNQGQDSLQSEQYMLKLFEEVITLLDGLRTCLTKQDRIMFLRDGGFETIAYNQKMDTQAILKPQISSYLRPGAIFKGQQKTSYIAAEQMRQRGWSRRRQIEQSTQEAIGHTSNRSREWTGRVVSAATTDQTEDCWPVKVTITGVDLERMTMTGTMEAFNVPSNKGASTAGEPKISSITTYLEGEIIDLHKHSLRTKNFEASLDTDATYWRKLDPFKSLDSKEIVTGMMDADWLSKNITNQWIIMRWKERCFVSPSDSDSGLTIAGFYYITLRRTNGKIEGLYHDPKACPYQHLNLMPEKPTFPIYAFR